MTKAKQASEVIFSKETPYVTLTGELWDVFCEALGEKWPRYNGTALCIEIPFTVMHNDCLSSTEWQIM